MILGIEGSPRKLGNSHILLDAFIDEVQSKSISASTVHLRDLVFSSCVGCEGCRLAKKCVRFNDDMKSLYQLIEQSQGLVLVSPVYNYNITSWVKAFLDRMYCYYDFADTVPRGWSSRLAGQSRKAVVIAIAEQEKEEDMGFAIEAMSLPLKAYGYDIISEIRVLNTFKSGDINKNIDMINNVREIARELTTLVSR